VISKFIQSVTYRLKKFREFVIGGNTWKEIPKIDFLLLCHDVNRGGEVDGKAFSPLIDTLQLDLQEKGFSCAQFAYPESKIVGSKAWGKPFHATSAWAFSCLVSCSEFRFFSKIVENLTFGKISLTEKFGKEAFYKKLLDQTKPRAVIGVEPYPVLCKVCRDKKIPIIEIFHGFGYTEKVFTYLWNEEPTPVGVLALDETSTRTFSSNYFKSKGVWCEHVGHPFYKRILTNKVDALFPVDVAVKPKMIEGIAKKILYSMSWGYAGDHGNYSEFEGILQNGVCPGDFLEVIKTIGEGYDFFFRVHPVHLRNKKKYKFIFEFLERLEKEIPNIEWRYASQATLPTLYKDIDCQISMRSETCYDASFFGVKTLLLCPSLKPGGKIENHFQDLYKNGTVEYWTGNKTDLINWIKKTKKTEPSKMDLDALDKNFTNSIFRMVGCNS
jgi:hypothetical protein